jgi:hypothetical protein
MTTPRSETGPGRIEAIMWRCRSPSQRSCVPIGPFRRAPPPISMRLQAPPQALGELSLRPPVHLHHPEVDAETGPGHPLAGHRPLGKGEVRCTAKGSGTEFVASKRMAVTRGYGLVPSGMAPTPFTSFCAIGATMCSVEASSPAGQ